MAYAPTEESSNTDKDSFYSQLELEPLINSTPAHDQLLVMGDFNVATVTDRTTLEDVIGNFGSGVPNDDTFRLITMQPGNPRLMAQTP